MAVMASETFSSVAAPIQYAAQYAFLGNEEIKDYQAGCRRVSELVGQHVAQELRQAGCSVHDPEGGFYLFPNLGPCDDIEDICEQLLQQTGVAVLPGTDFGRAKHEGYFRLAYVDFDGEEALKDPENALDHCPRVIEGVSKLVAWLNQ